MRAYSLNELFHLTRTELFALHTRTAAEIPALPESSPERLTASTNLLRIRWVLAQPRPGP